MTKISVLLLILLSGCVQKMGYESRPALRTPPAGTIARETRIVVQRTPLEKLRRGQERFDIYCSPCHGDAGYADGMIVKRGFLPPPSYHTEFARQLTDQKIYDAITNGYGAMYSYGDRVDEDDRWAIVAYIRALQFSQNAPVSALSEAERQKLGP